MATADKILLGYGTVTIGGTPVGLTRGGSAFMVERDQRDTSRWGQRTGSWKSCNR